MISNEEGTPATEGASGASAVEVKRRMHDKVCVGAAATAMLSGEHVSGWPRCIK